MGNESETIYLSLQKEQFMDLRKFLKKGIAIRIQRPNLPSSGPITPSLLIMSSMDDNNTPVSLVGKDLVDLIASHRIIILYVHTNGSGATPWRNQLVLDKDYLGNTKMESPGKIGLIAHELAHVLQRELRDPYYFPSGGFRPSLKRRPLGDSTNYMEVLANIVGWTVEHDLYSAERDAPGLSPDRKDRIGKRLRKIEDHLATLTGDDALNATRYVLKSFPDTNVYKKNHRIEAKLPDGRIPSGGWKLWIGKIGFSERALSHIRAIAIKGNLELVDPLKTNKIAGLGAASPL